MKHLFLILALVLVLGCGGEDEGDDLSADYRPEVDHWSQVDYYGYTDTHVCTDERGGVLDYASLVGHNEAAPLAWDGTPFRVNVSSSFHFPEDLLYVISLEAEKVRNHLGYYVFVPGDIIDLPDLWGDYYWDVSEYSNTMPYDGEMDIYCCQDNGIHAGKAQIYVRSMILSSDYEYAVYAVAHELYHLLGFKHPTQNDSRVTMSQVLYDDDIHSRPSAHDLDLLGCVFPKPGE